MKNYFYFLVFLMNLLFVMNAFGQDIVYVYDPARMDAVSGENPDVQVMRLLEEQGYTVSRFPHPDLQAVTDEQMDSLNSTDLIFIGRAVASTNFQSPNKEVWNDISVPIITNNIWALRNNRMNWFNTDGASNVDVPMEEVFGGYILEEEEEIFAHMAGDIEWWSGPYSDLPEGVDAGNGWVLVSKSDNGSPLLVRFDQGTSFYPGAEDSPADERVYIGSPSDNMLDADGNNIFNYLGYTEQSQKIFLNEVARMLGVFVGVSDFEESYSVDIYPNPTANKITVEMKNLAKVEVFDLSGKQLLQHVASDDNTTVDLSILEKGVYAVKVSDKKGVYTTRRITRN